MCHHNSKYYAEKEWLDIASVVCLENGWSVIAHFVNVDKNWNYIDNTIWDHDIYKEYYLVKIFKKEEFMYPNIELERLKSYIADIYNSFVPRYKKKLSYKKF